MSADRNTPCFASQAAVTSKRAEIHNSGVEQFKTSIADASKLLSPQEADILLRHYEHELFNFAKEVNYPDKVIAAALSFFKTFFLTKSIYHEAPFNILYASLWVASKSEEGDHHFLNAEKFSQKAKMEMDCFYDLELTLMEAINFEFMIFHPFRPLRGLLEDWRSEHKEDEPIQSAVAKKASTMLQNALLTDVPLFASPPLVALAALKASCDKISDPEQRFRKNFLKKFNPDKLKKPLTTLAKQMVPPTPPPSDIVGPLIDKYNTSAQNVISRNWGANKVKSGGAERPAKMARVAEEKRD